MQTVRSIRLVVPVATLAAVLAACASGETPAADSTAAAPTEPVRAVEIVSPRDGDTVSVPFTITFAESGVEVIPANGQAEPWKGHHHFVVDDEPVSDTLPLPPAPIVVHLGDGSRSRTIDSLPPGPHRIIAIFASGNHVPMAGVKRDTVNIVVR